MKSLSIVCASIAILAGVTFTAAGAFADPSINYNASKSNTGNVTVGQTTCPKGQAWDAMARRCVVTSSINYNASKSNTGNMVAPAPASGTQATNVIKSNDATSVPPK